jgi:putative endonuclease
MSETLVYILRCSDNSYYVGCTNNINRRLRDHGNGEAADYTAKRLPVELVYSEKHESLLSARKRERQLKGWTRIKKEKLICGDWKMSGRIA